MSEKFRVPSDEGTLRRSYTPRSSSGTMRYESAVTSLSWIPNDVMKGIASLPFDAGLTHFDPILPQEIEDFDEVGLEHPYRFANRLKAWIEVDDDGTIVEAGYAGGGHSYDAIARHDGRTSVFQAAALPTIQPPPEFGDGFVRFVQSAGEHGTTPVPRTLRRAPFVQWRVPLSWTTLALTIYGDGRATNQLVAASQFPRHWVYNAEGKLQSRTGLIDVDDWYRTCFDARTPWGDLDSRSLLAAIDAVLERSLSARLTPGAARPRVVKVPAGTIVARQGDSSPLAFLILEGYACVEADGARHAEYGVGALLGERRVQHGGGRVASIRASTKIRALAVPADALVTSARDSVATGLRRAEANAP